MVTIVTDILVSGLQNHVFFEENLQEKVKNAQKKLETGLKIDKIGQKSGKIDSKTHKDDDDLKEYIPHFAKKV